MQARTAWPSLCLTNILEQQYLWHVWLASYQLSGSDNEFLSR
eukprot:COSAG01_NODE_495_length_16308_cov_92.317088_18_plen_42_part_00